MDPTNIARVCHEVNRAYCESLMDFSQAPWDEAKEWQQKSAVNGVKFHLENPDATPEASHQSWLEEKQREGWKYGPLKDERLKLHPCCLPYQELPPSQRAKDYIFRAIVHQLRGFMVSAAQE